MEDIFSIWKIFDIYLIDIYSIWKKFDINLIFAVWLWEHQLSFLQSTDEHQQHWLYRSQLMLVLFYTFDFFLAIYIIFLILFTVSSHIYEYIWRIKTSVFQIWEHNFPMPVQISFPIMLFLRTVIGKVIHRPERKTVLTRFFFLSHQCQVIL